MKHLGPQISKLHPAKYNNDPTSSAYTQNTKPAAQDGLVQDPSDQFLYDSKKI